MKKPMPLTGPVRSTSLARSALSTVTGCDGKDPGTIQVSWMPTSTTEKKGDGKAFGG